MLIRSILYIIPIRFGRRRQVDPNTFLGRYYVNRRDPESGFVLLGDLVENFKDGWWGLTRRVSRNGVVLRDSRDRYAGNASGPYFNRDRRPR